MNDDIRLDLSDYPVVKIYYAVYELTPAPWGDDYRFIMQYDNRYDAEILVKCLNALSANFEVYKIVEWKK